MVLDTDLKEVLSGALCAKWHAAHEAFINKEQAKKAAKKAQMEWQQAKLVYHGSSHSVISRKQKQELSDFEEPGKPHCFFHL